MNKELESGIDKLERCLDKNIGNSEFNVVLNPKEAEYILKLMDRVEKLEKAFSDIKLYAKHKKHCELVKNPSCNFDGCDCGLFTLFNFGLDELLQEGG